MNRRSFSFKLWAVFFTGVFVSANLAGQVSVDDFRNPPRNACPSNYWEWMNGNIIKEGLHNSPGYSGTEALGFLSNIP